MEKIKSSSTYTPEKAKDLCDFIVTGRSMIKWCELNNVSYSNVASWLNEHPDFEKDYARAKEVQADFMADEILDLADTMPPTVIGKNGNRVIDNGWVTHQKNRVDARRWIAAKLKPKVYGDKQTVELTGKDGEPLSIRLIEAQQRLLKDITPRNKVIEHIATIALDDLI